MNTFDFLMYEQVNEQPDVDQEFWQEQHKKNQRLKKENLVRHIINQITFITDLMSNLIR